MPKQTNLAELAWPVCVLVVLMLSELGEVAAVVGFWNGDWQASTASRACFLGWYDSGGSSFQRFIAKKMG